MHKSIQIISGIHRSGTTFLGKLININNDFSSIHEPLNNDVGVKNNDFWYPYYSIKNKHCSSEKALMNIYNENLEFKNTNKGKFDFSRKLLKSRGNIQFITHKLFNPNKNIVYKDPFMSLCGHYFLERNPKSKMVFLIRHPKSFYKSNLKMNWDFDFNLFPLEQILIDYPVLKCNIHIGTYEERLYTLYNIIYFNILEIIKKFPYQTMFIRHEDFCINPEVETKKICNFFNIDYSLNHQKFIDANMKNVSSKIKSGKQFNFKRNSKLPAVDRLNKGVSDLVDFEHIINEAVLDIYR